jgi:proteic killer suppression protein
MFPIWLCYVPFLVILFVLKARVLDTLMIKSFRDGESGELGRFYLDAVRGAGIPSLLEGALRRKLTLIDAASEERALFIPRSNNYERLSGNLEGWSSIRVNIQWRLIFQWRDGAAYELYLDPHTYR